MGSFNTVSSFHREILQNRAKTRDSFAYDDLNLLITTWGTNTELHDWLDMVHVGNHVRKLPRPKTRCQTRLIQQGDFYACVGV